MISKHLDDSSPMSIKIITEKRVVLRKEIEREEEATLLWLQHSNCSVKTIILS